MVKSTPEMKPADIVEHDGYMPNTYPPRKMFSSIKVGEHTSGSKDMRIIRAIAKIVKK